MWSCPPLRSPRLKERVWLYSRARRAHGEPGHQARLPGQGHLWETGGPESAGGWWRGSLGRQGRAWPASAPGFLVSAASQDLFAQEPVPPGSGDGALQVRAQHREGGLGWALGWRWGAQAGGQSERYPHPWEDWEAGAESQPPPLRLRVTPDQDHLSLPIPAQSSLPMRIRLWSHLGVTRAPPSSSPTTLTQQLPVDSLP